VGLEAAWRLLRGYPGGPALRLEWLVLLLTFLAAAGGAGLLLGGGRPRELLHFVYAAVAMMAVPVSTSFSAGWPPRRRWMLTLLGVLVALVAIQRLFATG
jgi:hypothetical protein